MGNYRFRLSDMIPNSWLYKLKDMSSKANKSQPISYSSNTKMQVKKKPLPASSPAAKHTYRYFTSEQPAKDNTKPALTDFPIPPRKSKKKRRPINPSSSSSPSPISTSKKLSASVSASCHFAASMDSVWKSEMPPSCPTADGSRQYYMDNVQSSLSSSCSCRVTTSTSTSSDIPAVDMAKTGKIGVGFSDSISANSKIYNRRLDSVLLDSYSVDGNFGTKIDDDDGDHTEKKCGLQTPVKLPPILTKQAKFNLYMKNREGEANTKSKSKSKLNLGKMEEEIFQSHNHQPPVKSSPARRSTSSQGLRIRPNSPRLASKKIQAYTRRSRPPTAAKKGVSESFAVTKSSSDPHRDFRDSMVEMIVENNLSASKDLEDLLACYLSLNSDEYHGVIVRVFEQIWFDFTEPPL